MKIVLDTNVLVSGLLKPFSIPGDIVRLVAAGTLPLCYDTRILWEYKSVLLRPKFHFDPADVDSLLEQVEGDGIPVSASPGSHVLPDPQDEPFLEVALAGRADYLVTGNVRHFPKERVRGVKVVSPLEFVNAYRSENTDK